MQASITAPPGVASQAFTGASGATYVVCWQTANPYNPTTGVTSWPSPKLVTVNAPKASWSTFEPLTGAAASLVGAGPHTVSVGNGPVIVKAA